MTEALSFEEVLDRYGFLVCTNVGYSMMPLLRQGQDLMEIRKKGPERCKKYDVVLYRRGKSYILHRVIKVRERDYAMLGDHNTFLEYGIRDEDILGVLTAVVRDGKRIDVKTDLGYRLYVHLWCDAYPLRIAVLMAKARAVSVLRRVKGWMVR